MALLKIYSYVLKNPKFLPRKSFYVEPWDKTKFTPNPKESLDSFYQRILAYRQAIPDSIPPLPEPQYKELIQLSLAENASPKDRDYYFDSQLKMPQLSRAFMAIKALAQEAMSKDTTSIQQRQTRAKDCLNQCPFHITEGNTKLGNMFSKAVDMLDNAKRSETSGSQTAPNVYPEETKLGVCGVCGCPLKSKVKFSIQTVIPTIMPDELLNGFRSLGANYFNKCWMLKEATKDPYLKKVLFAKINANPNVKAENLFASANKLKMEN